jgi:purine-binding chemotaxis protein CheW
MRIFMTSRVAPPADLIYTFLRGHPTLADNPPTMSEQRGDRTESPAASAAQDGWYFCLRMLGGRYAFDAPLVTEVVRLGPLTRLPAAPSFLPGVFTHRGEVLPVLDVGQLVGLGSIPIRASTRAAIVRSGPWKVAVIAEAVEGLVPLARRQLEPAPAESSSMAEFLQAVGRDQRGTIAILDLPRLVEAARSRAVASGGAPA